MPCCFDYMYHARRSGERVNAPALEVGGHLPLQVRILSAPPNLKA